MAFSIIKSQFNQNKTSWKKSFLDGFSQDENGDAVPWMTYAAIEFLKKTINQNHEIFEFGAGASTLFFAKKAKKVVTLETNKKWFEIIQNSAPSNVELILMEDGLTNENYENFPLNYGQKFDFIIVDSLKRFNCAKNSISALKPDGMLILDDSERKNYQKIFAFLKEKDFIKYDFEGIAPAQLRIKNTTIFTKPAQPL